MVESIKISCAEPYFVEAGGVDRANGLSGAAMS